MAVSRPQALVYRGPATSEGLPEAVAHLLESSPQRFEVRYVGPGEDIDVTSETLKGVDVYAQPGGPGTYRSRRTSRRHSVESMNVCTKLRSADLDDAWTSVKSYATPIRDFVSRGGRYLGFCLGAYLAGRSPGFGLLPKKADTDSEIDQKHAQVTTDKDTIIQVDWNWSAGPSAGQTTAGRWIYFQEGAVIQGLKPSETCFILGRYSKSGGVAASLNKYGDGWVGLIGPHPEATQEWCKLEVPDVCCCFYIELAILSRH